MKTTSTSKIAKTSSATKAVRAKATRSRTRVKYAQDSKTKPARRTVTHHAKRLFAMTPKFVHGMVVGAFLGVLLVSFLRAQSAAQALSITVTRNCDNNAVIYCGALTTTELQQRYSEPGVATIYSYFGITAKDIQDINGIAQVGAVTKTGLVTVNGKTVATGALTVGRENISGSAHHLVDGVNFYVRKPSVAFLSSSIPAFVAFNSSGQFIFAILGSCGNSVIGTPVPQVAPKPPTPVTPTPTPTPVLPTTPLTPTTVLTTPPPVTTASVETTLPNTGPGAVFIIAGLAVISGYVFHMTHRHIHHKRQRRHAAMHHV